MKTKKELINEKMELQLENFRVKFELHRTESENKELKKEIERLKEDKSTPNLWSLVMMLLLFSSLNKNEDKENGKTEL